MPNQSLPSHPALLVDALAMLSGVNFGSVAKVLAAIDAISDCSKIHNPTPFHYAAVPQAAALPGSPSLEDRTRCVHAATYVHALIRDGFHKPYPSLHKQTERLTSGAFGLSARRGP